MKAGRIIIRAAAVLSSAAAALSAAGLKPVDAEISCGNTPARFSHAVTAAADHTDHAEDKDETDCNIK